MLGRRPAPARRAGSAPALSLSKVLDLADFSVPRVTRRVQEICRCPVPPDDPGFVKNAKAWEMAMSAVALDACGVLDRGAEVLGVGAGHEGLVYYLTRFVRRVFATDLYASGGPWEEAPPDMLVDPDAFAPPGLAWEPRRLVVQHMDALDLRHPDGAFDAIFSSGAIEHFGGRDQIMRAAAEMGRVLRPGGVAALATEFRIAGPPDRDGIAGAVMFTPDMIREWIVEPSGLRPVGRIDFTVPATTAALAYPIADALAGRVRSPSVALEHDGFTWTSIHLALRKPRPTRRWRTWAERGRDRPTDDSPGGS